MKTVLSAAILSMSMGLAMPQAMAAGNDADAGGNAPNSAEFERKHYESRAHEMIETRGNAINEEEVDLSEEAEEAWTAVKESWVEMRQAASENWEDAKATFQENWDAFQEEWDELTEESS